MRVESDKPATGDFGGWIHRIDGTPILRRPPPTPKPQIEQDWTALARECFDRGATLRTTLADELGVSIESLERLTVGSYFDQYRGLECSTWPESRPGGKVVGIVRRYSVPVSDGGGNKLTLKGSKHGVYLPRDWWRGTGPVLLVEGGSDTAALLTLGMSVIGRPTNVGGLNMLIGALHDCERPIIVIGERDRKPERVGTVSQCPSNCAGCSWCYPGRYGAKVTAERLKTALRNKRVLWRMPPDNAKDSRAWLGNETEPTAAKYLNRLTLA